MAVRSLGGVARALLAPLGARRGAAASTQQTYNAQKPRRTAAAAIGPAAQAPPAQSYGGAALLCVGSEREPS